MSVPAIRWALALTAVCAALVALPAPAAAATQCINPLAPAPLEICVQDSGTPGVWLNQNGTRQHQYYGQYSWMSLIALNGTDQSARYATRTGYGTAATAVSNTLTGSGTAADPFVITTVLNLGTTGVQLEQRFIYVNGDRYFKKRWTLRHTGSATYSDVRFFHGGDTYFGGSDSARSWYSSSNRMVYVNNNAFTTTGYMGFYASPVTPSVGYFGGNYGTAYQQMGAAQLSNTASSSFVDAGYALQWNRTSLAPGQTWIIEAFETWSAAGSLQVMPPSDDAASAGTTVRRTYSVHNLNASVASGEVALGVEVVGAPAGWSAALVGSSTLADLAALARTDVEVDVTIPAGAAPGAAYDIRLTADPAATGVPNGVGSFKMSVLSSDVTVSPNPLEFGYVLTDTSTTRTLTLSNAPTGTPLRLGAVGATDPLASPFAITADTCSFNPVAPGASCSVTVSFAPTSGASAADSFDIAIQEPVASLMTVQVGGNRQVGGTFTVTPSAGAGGSLTPATPQTVAAGETTSFVATPAAGHLLGSVSGCGGTLVGTTYTTAAVNTDCTVRATFYASPVAVTGSGGDQYALLFNTFANALAVTVQDANNVPVEGATVTFTTPGSGASAVLSATSAVTDGQGRVSVTASANGIAGSYTVSASALGASTNFALTNVIQPTNMAAIGGTPQSAAICTAFGSPLTVRVRDANNLPVPNVPVGFSAPGTGASALLSAASVVTDNNGEASITATGNSFTGSYSVTASVTGIAPATFALTNASGTPCNLPGAPTGVSGTAGDGQVTVSWTAPADDGGVAISNYQVTVSPAPAGGSATRSVGSTSTTFVFTNLVNGTAYTFTVRAVNSVGSGPASAPSDPVTPAAGSTAPGAPTGIAGTPGNGQAALSWTAPSSDGGSPVTGYQVQVAINPGGPYTNAAGCPTNQTAPSCTAAGLVNGVTYYFRVAAINTVGTGDYSSPSAGVTPTLPITVPGVPTGVAGTPGHQQASLTWIAPADTGGVALTGYQVQVATNAAGPYSNAAGCGTSNPSPSCTAGSLANGTTYFFRVAAINTAGVGLYSTASDGVTPFGAPGAPSAPAGIPGNAQVELTWQPPSDNGGTPLTGYRVQMATSVSGPFADTACPAGDPTAACVVGSLANGTTYYFRVAAINPAGTGGYSAPSAGVTPRTVPGASTAVTAVAGDAQASVSWTAPSDNGGAPVLGYLVQVSAGGGGVFVDASGCGSVGSGTSCTATNLENGVEHVFRVAATNAAGTGPYSNVSNPVKPVASPTVPGAPTGVTGVARDEAADVAWTPPAETGGSPITAYTVQVSTSLVGPFSDASGCANTTTEPSCRVTGLVNGLTYYFRVAATNSVGLGAYSAPSNAVTPSGLPARPPAPTAVAGDAQATVTVQPAASGPAPTSYVITALSGGTPTGDVCTVVGAAGSCVVADLVNGREYTFTATAVNTSGSSEPSDPSKGVTPVAPGPQRLTVHSVEGHTVTLVWDPPDSLIAPSGYQATLGMLPDGTGIVVPVARVGGALPDVLTAVLPEGIWYVSLQSLTDGLPSASSNQVRVVIGSHGTPSAPADVLATVQGKTVQLSWTATYEGTAPTGMRLRAWMGDALVAQQDLPMGEALTAMNVASGTYTVSVSALHGSFEGAGSTPASFDVGGETCTIPGAPTRVRHVLAGDGRTVTVVWFPPADGGAVAEYELQVTGAANVSRVQTARMLTVEAPPGVYQVRVVARNACGTSAASEVRTIVVP